MTKAKKSEVTPYSKGRHGRPLERGTKSGRAGSDRSQRVGAARLAEPRKSATLRSNLRKVKTGENPNLGEI